MGIGVIDTHAVSAGVLLHQGGDRIIGFLTGPIALPLEQNLLPCHRNDTCLHHAIHGAIVGFEGGTARCVGDHVDLVIRYIMEG
ncbi:hypothetical protein D3C71_1421160 [compost metagenome]